MGVWIETFMYPYGYALRIVTPFVGVWIETWVTGYDEIFLKSHPSWVCGLKLISILSKLIGHFVTPFVGVWIETLVFLVLDLPKRRHTLRGCVD